MVRVGGYPVFAGTHDEGNVTANDPKVDNWSRTLVVFYPSRRAFMEHVSYKPFQDIEPFKFMALDVALCPAKRILTLISPTWLSAGLFLLLFAVVGWWRAAHAL